MKGLLFPYPKGPQRHRANSWYSRSLPVDDGPDQAQRLVLVPLHQAGRVQSLHLGPLSLHQPNYRRHVGQPVQPKGAHLPLQLCARKAAQQLQQHQAAAQVEADVGDDLVAAVGVPQPPVDPAGTCFLLNLYAFL